MDNLTERFMSTVYDDLRTTVRAVLASEGKQHVLHPSALVRQACFRLFRPARTAASRNSNNSTEWQSRAQFLAMAVRQIRLVLADSASQTQTILLTDFPVRGGDVVQSFHSIDLLLNLLAASAPTAAQAFELRCFGGLTEWETAFIVGVSTAQVKREIESARAWFKTRTANNSSSMAASLKQK